MVVLNRQRGRICWDAMNMATTIYLLCAVLPLKKVAFVGMIFSALRVRSKFIGSKVIMQAF